jgi:hypothetical protein
MASLAASPIARMTPQHPVRQWLRAAGAGRALLKARYFWRLTTDAGFRRIEMELFEDYLQWRWRHRAALQPSLYPAGSTKRALIVGKGTLNGAQVELSLIKGLELAGFVPVVLTNRTDLEKHYRLAGVRSFARWDAFSREPSPENHATATAWVTSATSLEDLIAIEHAGARVGKFAISSAFRSLRVGRLCRRLRPATK